MLHFTYGSGFAANHPKRNRYQIFVIELLRPFPLIVGFLIFMILFIYTNLLLLRVYNLHQFCGLQ